MQPGGAGEGVWDSPVGPEPTWEGMKLTGSLRYELRLMAGHRRAVDRTLTLWASVSSPDQALAGLVIPSVRTSNHPCGRALRSGPGLRALQMLQDKSGPGRGSAQGQPRLCPSWLSTQGGRPSLLWASVLPCKSKDHRRLCPQHPEH